MPFQGVSAVEQRRLFVEAAQAEGSNIRELCRAFGISPTTVHKWLGRVKASGPSGLCEQSRRPHRSPRRTPSAVEREVIEIRREHPCWGGRKIHHVLRHRGCRRCRIRTRSPTFCIVTG